MQHAGNLYGYIFDQVMLSSSFVMVFPDLHVQIKHTKKGIGWNAWRAWTRMCMNFSFAMLVCLIVSFDVSSANSLSLSYAVYYARVPVEYASCISFLYMTKPYSSILKMLSFRLSFCYSRTEKYLIQRTMQKSNQGCFSDFSRKAHIMGTQ